MDFDRNFRQPPICCRKFRCKSQNEFIASIMESSCPTHSSKEGNESSERNPNISEPVRISLGFEGCNAMNATHTYITVSSHLTSITARAFWMLQSSPVYPAKHSHTPRLCHRDCGRRLAGNTKGVRVVGVWDNVAGTCSTVESLEYNSNSLVVVQRAITLRHHRACDAEEAIRVRGGFRHQQLMQRLRRFSCRWRSGAATIGTRVVGEVNGTASAPEREVAFVDGHRAEQRSRTRRWSTGSQE